MDGVTRELPKSAQLLRSRLYAGEIFLIAANTPSLQLVDAVWNQIESDLSRQEAREAIHRYDRDELFQMAGGWRQAVYSDRDVCRQLAAVLESMKIADSRTSFDPAKLRVVFPDGHRNPAAAPVYYGHRDTWYANPACTINWWIPLHDVGPEDSFCFYPDSFDAAVENDSEIFDFDQWASDGENNVVGWQNSAAAVQPVYPRLTGPPAGIPLPVTAAQGDVLIFAGQHLHQTTKQQTGRIRYSIDFRTIDHADYQAGRGAPCVDNRSTGCWGTTFRPLPSLEEV